MTRTNRNDDFAPRKYRKTDTVKNGARLRVPMVMMDSRYITPARIRDSKSRNFRDLPTKTGTRARLPVVVDGAGKTDLSRPGFRRVLSNDKAAAIKEQAYQEYEQRLVDSYKDASPPAGAYPYSASSEGTSCTINGMPGTLVKQGGWLVCQPNEDDDDETQDAKSRRKKPDDEDDDEQDLENQTGDSRTVTPAAVQQQMKDHSAKMESIYDRRDSELREAWRKQT